MSDERKWEPDNRQAEGSPGANENRENIQNEQDTRNAQNTTNGKNTQSGESREEKRPMTHPYSRYNPESQNASGIGRYGNPEPQRRRSLLRMVLYLQDTDIIRCMKIREVQAETEILPGLQRTEKAEAVSGKRQAVQLFWQ